MDDAITQSAAKLGFELREKQRQALLGFCQGRDVFVSLPTGYGKSIIYALLPMIFNMLHGNIYLNLCVLITVLFFRCDKQYCSLYQPTHCNNAGADTKIL